MQLLGRSEQQLTAHTDVDNNLTNPRHQRSFSVHFSSFLHALNPKSLTCYRPAAGRRYTWIFKPPHRHCPSEMSRKCFGSITTIVACKKLSGTFST